MDSGSEIDARLKPRTVLLEIEIEAMLKPRTSHSFLLVFMTEAMSILVFRTKINLGSVVVDEGCEGKT